MPAKHQISTALDESGYLAIKALADATGQSKSGLVKQIISESAPKLMQLAQAIELAKSHTSNARRDVTLTLGSALDDLISEAQDTQESLRGL